MLQLGHSREVIGILRLQVHQPSAHFLASRLSESLHDVTRVAESRGARLDAVRIAPGAGQECRET
ncbi:hypothetical protein ABCR94_06740 [Streptomyces sp. 21So2-11]|uniref:hypothetical protein n=1 Tax=Streptomyces sp. 21So2-11 TaxID=3144408 RepID=UPI00321B1E7D